MKITPKVIIFALATALLFIMFWTKIAAPKSSSFTKPQTSVPNISTIYESKKNSGGNVTIEVAPLTLAVSQTPVFRLTFTTHSVNLDFDAAQVATLTDDTNRVYGQGIWDGSPPGGHHRQGTLIFSSPLAPQTKSVTLTIANVAGIPSRTFDWEVKKS